MKIQGYEVRKFAGPTKRYCQILNLKDDQDLIELIAAFTAKRMPGLKSGQAYVRSAFWRWKFIFPGTSCA